MKTHALITMLLLGSSTAALASPLHFGHGPVVRAPVHAVVAVRPVVRERVRPVWGAPVVGAPGAPIRPIVRERYFHAPLVVLSAPVVIDVPLWAPAPTAFVDGAETISLNNVTGAALELNADGGRTFVQSALITYADGNQQSVAIGQELDGRNPGVELQTDGSPIASVTVFGMGRGVAAFMV
jgi:hypothetical protein